MENTAPLDDDEYDAASSLLLLSESNGGFCNPTISTHEEASTIKIETQKRASPGTPLALDDHTTADKGKAAAVAVDTEDLQCSICHETFATWQALRNHFDQSKLAGKPSTSANGGASTCDVDLNLPPPE
ncbi:hypothetical protein SASPL_119654 [Salvia splendens]|uniref:C2H2-type domain-containing protein n=1 Tax=Salvia splendens TaxID=180675 RepID=A0A8X8XRT3_SALSN|nr:uncharacterized protein LOC121741699 [Salvia splendens]KAG6417474.1 hypothetical protein SASPL_119654 [Salvia splendens]